MHVELRSQPAVRTAATAHTGPYREIGQTFMNLFEWAKGAGLIPEDGIGSSKSMAVYYDNPRDTPPDRLRSDACHVVPEGAPIIGSGVRELVVPGGKYAVTTYTGPYSGIGDAWQEFTASWLPTSGHAFDPSRAHMEIYVDLMWDVPAEKLRTELLIPVQG